MYMIMCCMSFIAAIAIKEMISDRRFKVDYEKYIDHLSYTELGLK